jgi:hypothetical protein
MGVFYTGWCGKNRTRAFRRKFPGIAIDFDMTDEEPSPNPLPKYRARGKRGNERRNDHA